MRAWLAFCLLCCLAPWVDAAPKSVRVFVALCDNRTQGIQRVAERIGNGDDPEANLYWGCSDGLSAYFRKSSRWRLKASRLEPDGPVLRRLEFEHREGDVTLVAAAYRGSEMRRCLQDFEAAAATGGHDLVVFVGHNGLMDFELPQAEPSASPARQSIVLCCLSDSYFRPRLKRLGCAPLLLTRQLMYPGAFLLHDALEVWRRGGSAEAVRAAAGHAYARHQRISPAAGAGIFARAAE
ncbi:MAG: hypothetical protein JSR82_08480 [Verrucomicrobia bacterium]|nr:hypothetical protein [Verrucomicrobiota bacterium]